MVNILYLERQKTEIVAEHIKRNGLTPLDETDQKKVNEIERQIKLMRGKESDKNDKQP